MKGSHWLETPSSSFACSRHIPVLLLQIWLADWAKRRSKYFWTLCKSCCAVHIDQIKRVGNAILLYNFLLHGWDGTKSQGNKKS